MQNWKGKQLTQSEGDTENLLKEETSKSMKGQQNISPWNGATLKKEIQESMYVREMVS